MEGTTLGLTALLCTRFPKLDRKKQGAVPPQGSPTPIYFLVRADAGQVLSEGLGPEEGRAQAPGAKAVWVLAVYIGCFILHRVLQAKVGGAWANVPICTALNKVGL